MRKWTPEEEWIKSYNAYIQSEEWKHKREEAFIFYGRSCQACGRYKNLHIHHADYLKIGNEPVEDLRVLCKRCHKDLHKKMIKRKLHNLRAWTNSYIRNKGKPEKKKNIKMYYSRGKIREKRLTVLSTGNYCVDDNELL